MNDERSEGERPDEWSEERPEERPEADKAPAIDFSAEERAEAAARQPAGYLRPVSVELVKHLRDGGSVVIEFATEGEDGSEIRMPLRKAATGGDDADSPLDGRRGGRGSRGQSGRGKRNRRGGRKGKGNFDGYHPPVVVDFTLGRTFELTWDQAAILGRELEPLASRPIATGTRELLEAAIAIMKARGTMKPGRKGRLVPVDTPPSDPQPPGDPQPPRESGE